MSTHWAPQILLFAILFVLGATRVVAFTPEVQAQDQALTQDVANSISPSEFAERRQAVLDALPEDGVAVFFSSPVFPRYGDVDYPFHQQADIRYLTGTTMPGTVLLLAPGMLQIGDDEFEELLLIPEQIAPGEARQWYSPEEAEAEGGFQRVETTEYFETLLTPIIESDRRIYHLPLPEAVVPESELGRQLSFFTEHTQLLDLGTSPALRDAVASIMDVDTEAAFRDLQSYARDVLDQASFDTPLGREMYQAFIEAASFSEWQSWREEHLDYRYTNATALRPVLDELRLSKSPAEISLMRQAAEISAEAARRVMHAVELGATEHEMRAIAEYVITSAGARTAFESAIRAGANALDPASSASADTLIGGELVVMEFGALVQGYTSTIRRTVPVDETFSEPQRELYELVVEAQEAAFDAVQIGEPFRVPEQEARDVLSSGLVDLGIIASEDEAFEYLPDILSHYIGLHVRDVGFGEAFESGQTIVVAAGVTIPESDEIDEQWRGASVHLQDVVVVTPNGADVLTAPAPIQLADVESERKRSFDASAHIWLNSR